MEINQVKDLLPYRKSLQEIWEQEEFQPVLKLCEALKQQVTINIANLDVTDSFKTAAFAAELKGRVNMTLLFLNLPKVLKDIEDAQTATAAKKQSFVKANEPDFAHNEQAKVREMKGASNASI